LLGSVDGLDGIKTGYIHDSGFNIVTSVRRANHYVVAVVFGGRSANARDARVRSLIDNNINIAAVKRTAPPVIEGRETAVARRDSKDGKEDDRTGSAPVRVASAAQAPAPPATDAPAAGSTEPIKPVTVRTVAVHPGTVYAASLTPLPSDNRQLTPAPAVTNAANITTIATVRSEPPPAGPTVAAAPPPASSPAASPPDSTPVAAAPAPVPVPPPAAPTAKVASAGNSVPVPTASAAPAIKPRGTWLIQIGALPDESEAKQRLETAQSKAKDLLGRADPFTERTEKGDKVLFRARFAGLEKGQAEAACKHLKRSAIPCMLLKN
jgi:D-alanyl-D-alanine carboxypeptidase